MEISLKAIKDKLVGPQPNASDDIGDVYISQSMKHQGIFKALMPRHMYSPPFGYPREENLVLAKQLARNPFIYSIEKSIRDEVSLANYDISFVKDSEKKEDKALEEIRKQILKFFRNPNQNKESFGELRKMAVKDIIEVDAGVWIKVFNKMGQFCQMFARDGSSILMNPDIYGYMGDRAEIIFPEEESNQMFGMPVSPHLMKKYAYTYSDKAAYFQYGTATSATIPIPFGRREVVYMKDNVRGESPYGYSPLILLSDVIMTLVYGSNYNLDFYMNSNMPEGIIQLIGANDIEIKAFRKRIEKEYRVKDENTGFYRKVAFKVPITGAEAKFTPFQIDPKTMQVLEQQSWFYKLVLACFGIPPNAMGIDDGNGLRSGDGDNQFRMYLRRSAKPIMQLMKYKIDMEIISEWGEDAAQNLEFKWDEYDLDEDLKKHELYQKQVNIGIKSPKMIAEDLGIDYSEVEKYQEEKRGQELEKQQAQAENLSSDEKNTEWYNNKEPTTTETKSVESEIKKRIKDRTKKLIGALEEIDNGRNKQSGKRDNIIS